MFFNDEAPFTQSVPKDMSAEMFVKALANGGVWQVHCGNNASHWYKLVAHHVIEKGCTYELFIDTFARFKNEGFYNALAEAVLAFEQRSQRGG